ncbi:class I SAM-dependent methyltransferase [Desulfobacterales bacterium HSG17]|nr:class I SAM-dependent methyltransferase [Desulfobacterales bacterium HSG17]
MAFLPHKKSYPTEDHNSMAAALGISHDKKVLDIGGGHNPFGFADVVVDIDFFSGHHRDGNQIILDHANHEYIQADIANLPFSDKSFDFIICVQVLEHVDDPAKACEEIMRVAHRGFIETPRKWTEFYAGHPTHKWLIDDTDDVLSFEPVTFNNSPFMNFALPPLWDSAELKKYLDFYRNIPCVQLFWEDYFFYKVRDSRSDLSCSSSDLAVRHFNFAKNLLYWMAPAQNGLYHASYAFELAKDNSEYSSLYAFYLALSGNWKAAIKQGLTFKSAWYAVICSILMQISKHFCSWYRRIISACL